MENKDIRALHDAFYFILAATLTAALFFLDIATPVGTATGILNVLPLIAALQIKRKHVYIIAPAVLSAIAIAALFLKPGRAPTWIPTINRTFTVIVLAAVSYSSYLRNRADKALSESERKYRGLMEHANSIIVRWDADGSIRFMNDYGLRYFGYDWNEISGRYIGMLWPERDDKGHPARIPIDDMCRHPGKYRRWESENVLKSGERVWVSWMNDFAGDKEEVQATGSDITVLKRTERQWALAAKEAEKKAREAEERHRILEAIMVNVPEGLTITEASSGALILASKMFANIIGIPLEKLTGMTIDERKAAVESFWRDTLQPIPDKDLPLTRALLQGEMTLNREILVKRRDGSAVTVLVNAMPVRDASGSITHAILSWRDITDRKQMEENLRRSEYELRTIMENTPDLVFRLDRSMRYVFANAAYERVTGIRREDLTGRTNHELGMPRERTDAWEPVIREAFSTGRETTFEFDISGFFGKRLFRARVIPELTKTGQVETVMVHARDVSDRLLEVLSK